METHKGETGATDKFVLKKIIFNKENEKYEVIYLRQLGGDYTMAQPAIEENYFAKMKRISFGTPQDSYPEDEIDQLIYSAIQKKYSEAKKENTYVFCDKQFKEIIDKYSNKESITIAFLFEPDMNSVQSMSGQVLPQVRLQIYPRLNYGIKDLKDLELHATISREKIQEIKQKSKDFKCLSDFYKKA